ncbi:MAG TPA: GAF domain-containing protein [Anaerolineae bacterium]|nr:GAF domain-containing protein [Anaerolineae bacterium]
MASELDQLEANIVGAEGVGERIDALVALGRALLRKDIARAGEAGDEALALAQEIGDVYREGICLGCLAAIANRVGEHEQAIEYGQKSVAILESWGELGELVLSLETVAVAYWRLSDLSESLVYFLKQLAVCEQLGDEEAHGRVLSGLGVLYSAMGEMEKAIAYEQQGLALFRKIGNKDREALLLNNMSYHYMKMGDYDEALRLGLVGLELAESEKDIYRIIVLAGTLGETYMKKGDIGEAERHCLRGLALLDQHADPNSELDLRFFMGQIKLAQGETAEALTYLEVAVALGERVGNKDALYQAYELMGETRVALGDYQAAYEAQLRCNRIKDEIYNEERATKLRQIEVAHRTAVAEKEASHYADLYASEQSRRQLTEILQQLGQAMVDQVDLGQMLAEILRQLAVLVSFDRGAVLLWRDERLVPITVWPEGSGVWEEVPLVAIGEGPLGIILGEKRPFLTTTTADLDLSPLLRPYFAGGSWLGVPLLRQEVVIGVLTLARREAVAYDEEGVQMARALAAQAAVTIENKRLYQQSEQRAEALTTLAQVGEDILASLDLQVVLERLATHAHQLFNAIQTVLWLRQDEGELFAATVAIGKYSDELRADPMRLGEGFAGGVAQSGQAEIINDMDEGERGKHVPGTPEREETPAALMCAPLQMHNQTIGVLVLYREKAAGSFMTGDLEFLVGLARQAIIAIENARLYRRVQKFNEQLEQEVVARTADLQVAYKQLERLDRTKSDFIAVTAHELRTPITILRGYGQLLEQDALLVGHDYQMNLVSGMVNGARRMHEIVNTMLTMVKVDSRSLELQAEAISLGDIVKKVVRQFRVEIGERKQTVIVEEGMDDLPVVQGDREALMIVFENLITNGIKYTPDGGQIMMRGRMHEVDGRQMVEVQVEDTGIGIAGEALPLIFDKFYQTGEVANHSSGKTKFKGGGPGLGLAIARGIVEAHGGRLWAESEGYDESRLPGSIFYLLLPSKG